jgi:hypothetical protein
VEYISERITNIADLEELVDECCTMVRVLQTESPHNENFQSLIDTLNQIQNFEFKIEHRKITYCE